MADKMGSSSYQNGDCGGSAGDYHGVSTGWLRKRVAAAAPKASTKRLEKFIGKTTDNIRKTTKNRRMNKNIAAGGIAIQEVFNRGMKPKKRR